MLLKIELLSSIIYVFAAKARRLLCFDLTCVLHGTGPDNELQMELPDLCIRDMYQEHSIAVDQIFAQLFPVDSLWTNCSQPCPVA